MDICGPTVKDAWDEGWKIGQRLAAGGVDERAIHGGRIEDGEYYMMNATLPLYKIPKRLPKNRYQDFLDGVIDGFENNDGS